MGGYSKAFLLIASVWGIEGPSWQVAEDPDAGPTDDRQKVIVKWKSDQIRSKASEETLCQKEGQKNGVESAQYLKKLGICVLMMMMSDSEVAVHTFANRADVAAVEKDQMLRIFRTPNDPLFSDQWHHFQENNIDIDSTSAWDITTGQEWGDVVVAVIDTGVDYEHEDLKERMWINPDEIPGNGIDDDGNGIVDDIYGADFANNDGDPIDDQGHGTHCAGIVAAQGNNGVGVAGVAWRGVKIMALKFLTATGSGSSSDALSCLNYALEKGVKISSNSWGGGGSSEVMRQALEQAQEDGHLFIVAAGNDANDNDASGSYPCAYDTDNVLCVASTTYTDAMSSFSNYGTSSVDVGAPGSQIMSCKMGGGYVAKSGTSMACPNVAGIAGLLQNYRPQLKWNEIKDLIMTTVDKTEAMAGRVVANGRVNVNQALLAAAAGFDGPISPDTLPESMSFQDFDERIRKIFGTVAVTFDKDPTDIYALVFFFATNSSIIQEILEVDVPKTEAASKAFLSSNAVTFEYALAASVPASATHLAVKVANGAGLSLGALKIELEDVGFPEADAQNLAFIWENPESGFIEGVLTFDAAADEGDITSYHVTWGDGTFIEEVQSIGAQTPSCAGVTCEEIQFDQQDGSWRVEHRDYRPNERATFTFYGPGTFDVSYVDVEDGYDFLLIGDQVFTGYLEESLQITVPEAGPVQVQWESDEFIQSDGFIFTFTPAHGYSVLILSGTPTQSYSLQVSSAYRAHVRPDGPSVSIIGVDGASQCDETHMTCSIPNQLLGYEFCIEGAEDDENCQQGNWDVDGRQWVGFRFLKNECNLRQTWDEGSGLVVEEVTIKPVNGTSDAGMEFICRCESPIAGYASHFGFKIEDPIFQEIPISKPTFLKFVTEIGLYDSDDFDGPVYEGDFFPDASPKFFWEISSNFMDKFEIKNCIAVPSSKDRDHPDRIVIIDNFSADPAYEVELLPAPTTSDGHVVRFAMKKFKFPDEDGVSLWCDVVRYADESDGENPFERRLGEENTTVQMDVRVGESDVVIRNKNLL